MPKEEKATLKASEIHVVENEITGKESSARSKKGPPCLCNKPGGWRLCLCHKRYISRRERSHL